MQCAKCGGKLMIKKTYQDLEENEVIRVRECRSCKDRIHTIEFEIEENEILKERLEEIKELR